MSIEQYKKEICRVTSITPVTPLINVIKLEKEDLSDFSFKAGQYITIECEAYEPRSYSIANSATQNNYLELHIKNTGRGLSAHITDNIKIGDCLPLTLPHGDSYLRDLNKPILGIAGGVGVVPLKSIIETVLHHKTEKPVHLYLGTNTEEEMYLKQYFDNLSDQHLNLSFNPVFAEPVKSYKTGLVGSIVADDFKDLSGFHIYLSGPPPMIEHTKELLIKKGANPQDIF